MDGAAQVGVHLTKMPLNKRLVKDLVDEALQCLLLGDAHLQHL